ncbi:hypothetical protein EDC01DRAFT_479848 [Geopyxis carbonaria]|nr:hypothetical protein EDC01DRAFT_479848 [Geopyxis carbonaria]
MALHSSGGALPARSIHNFDKLPAGLQNLPRGLVSTDNFNVFPRSNHDFDELPAGLKDLYQRSSDYCGFNSVQCGAGCTESLGTCCSATESMACAADENCVQIKGSWGCCPAGEKCDWIKKCQDYAPGNKCKAGPKEQCCPASSPVCLSDGSCGSAESGSTEGSSKEPKSQSATKEPASSTTAAEAKSSSTSDAASSTNPDGAARKAAPTSESAPASSSTDQAHSAAESSPHAHSSQIPSSTASKSSPAAESSAPQSSPLTPAPTDTTPDSNARIMPIPSNARIMPVPNPSDATSSATSADTTGYAARKSQFDATAAAPSTTATATALVPPYLAGGLTLNGTNATGYGSANGSYGNYTSQFTGAAARPGISICSAMIMGLLVVAAVMGGA